MLLWIIKEFSLALMLSTVAETFSRRHFEVFFLFFPEKKFCHFMRILFSRKKSPSSRKKKKKKKKVVKMSSAELGQRVVNVKTVSVSYMYRIVSS